MKLNQVKEIAKSLYATHGATLKREEVSRKVVFGVWYKKTDCDRLISMIWQSYKNINS